MYQISVNAPTKIPVNSSIIETLVHSTSTETLVHIINTEILINSINQYPFKYPGPHKYHTWQKTVLYV